MSAFFAKMLSSLLDKYVGKAYSFVIGAIKHWSAKRDISKASKKQIDEMAQAVVRLKEIRKKVHAAQSLEQNISTKLKKELKDAEQEIKNIGRRSTINFLS